MSDSTMSERIAEEVRVTLARRRLSASELARRMGVTQPYISRRLTGDITIDVNDLEKIAAALDVEVADLLPTPVRRSGQRTNSDSPHSPVLTERTMTEQPTPVRFAHHHPTDTRVTSRTGVRRPRVRSWSHDGVPA